MKGEEKDEIPDICDPETLAAALKIQSAFKGYQVRKVQKKVPLTPQPSLDFENLTPADFIPSKLPSKRVPPVPQRSATTEIQKQTSTPVSKPVPKPFGVKDSPKSPLPARSSKLKEVPIPSVPPQTKQRQRVPSSSSSNFSEPEKETKHKYEEAGGDSGCQKEPQGKKDRRHPPSQVPQTASRWRRHRASLARSMEPQSSQRCPGRSSQILIGYIETK